MKNRRTKKKKTKRPHTHTHPRRQNGEDAKVCADIVSSGTEYGARRNIKWKREKLFVRSLVRTFFHSFGLSVFSLLFFFGSDSMDSHVSSPSIYNAAVVPEYIWMYRSVYPCAAMFSTIFLFISFRLVAILFFFSPFIPELYVLCLCMLFAMGCHFSLPTTKTIEHRPAIICIHNSYSS